jgi:hypothetical protein
MPQPITREKRAAKQRIEDGIKKRRDLAADGKPTKGKGRVLSMMDLDPIGIPANLRDMIQENQEALSREDSPSGRIALLYNVCGFNPILEMMARIKATEHIDHIVRSLENIEKCGMLTELQCEEIRFAVMMLQFMNLESKEVAGMLKELANYITPKMKASEVKQTIDQTVSITMKRYGGE